jgi:hypothetical protein
LQPRLQARSKRSPIKSGRSRPDRSPILARGSPSGNFFERDWQRSFWGANYPRLQAVKAKYDPDGLFFVHHGVGRRIGAPTDSLG